MEPTLESPQSIQVEQSPKSPLSLPMILFLLVFLSIGFASFVFHQPKEVAPLDDISSPELIDSMDTSTWSTYTHEEFKFKIKFPADYTHESLFNSSSLTKGESEISIYFDEYDNPKELSLNDWCIEGRYLNSLCLSWEYSPQYSTNYLNINGIDVVYIIEEDNELYEELPEGVQKQISREKYDSLVKKVSNYYFVAGGVLVSMRALYEDSLILDEMIKTLESIE